MTTNTSIEQLTEDAKKFRDQEAAETFGMTLDAVEAKVKKIKGDIPLPDESIPVVPELKRIISERKEQEESRKADDLLGLPLSRFSQIKKNIDGLQAGLYLIGGDPNTGKTALLTSLFLDAIQSSPDAFGLFFSLDDSAGTIITRMVANLGGAEINQIQKPNANQRGGGFNEMRNEGYSTLTSLAEDRFNLFDTEQITDYDRMIYYIEHAAQIMQGRKLVIAVDGLHNLETGSQGDQRSANIDRANKIKKVVNDYSCPVMVTVELRKGDARKGDGAKPTLYDIMETGKYAYNANLVWMLWNERPEQLEKEASNIYITLLYVKNKLSAHRVSQYLCFSRKQSKMTEIDENKRPEDYPEKNTVNATKKQSSEAIKAHAVKKNNERKALNLGFEKPGK